MSETKLGELPTIQTPKDAVHVAVFQATSDTVVHPGENVVIESTDPVKVRSVHRRTGETIGIVDPFLGVATVAPGTRFWVVVKPGTAKNLRHDWTHPLFAAAQPAESQTESAKAVAKAWLEGFADCRGYDFAFIVNAATTGGWDGIDILGQLDASVSDTFWRQIEAFTGRPVPQNVRDAAILEEDDGCRGC